ncbi:hypothetical protein IFM89_027979 [Coptis chinensis]|uniref:DUF4283 domain-containing protein n=1 Tax=Coptis chinensis TaxID=261450 RepID=A0A835LF95_9MAGN|nr:hypothetical protein IFM89_027979 [Coptis chinensis]
MFLQNRAAAHTRNLKHFTHQEVNGVTIVPMDLIMQGFIEWSEYVIGFFIEQRLSFTYVKNVLQQRWKDKVLEEGPIFIGGRCLIIIPWTRGVEKQRNLLTTVPLWVKIHNVPKELCTDDGLGFLASKVARCESYQNFWHATENCSRDANSVRRTNINGTGRVNIRTNVQTGLDSNSANRAQEGGQNERISTNTNVSHENIGRNTIIYVGNGTGENERRRIWRVRSHPTSLSEVAGTSCIWNDRGEETREQNSYPAAQDKLVEIPIDAGQSELTEDRTQMTEVTIEMHDSMQMVVNESQVEELVLVVQPNPF